MVELIAWENPGKPPNRSPDPLEEVDELLSTSSGTLLFYGGTVGGGKSDRLLLRLALTRHQRHIIPGRLRASVDRYVRDQLSRNLD